MHPCQEEIGEALLRDNCLKKKLFLLITVKQSSHSQNSYSFLRQKNKNLESTDKFSTSKIQALCKHVTGTYTVFLSFVIQMRDKDNSLNSDSHQII